MFSPAPQAHRNCGSMSEIEAKVRYVKLARSLKTYGVSFFLVKVSYVWARFCPAPGSGGAARGPRCGPLFSEALGEGRCLAPTGAWLGRRIL